jgi:lactose/L-arabinose transport system permease protein
MNRTRTPAYLSLRALRRAILLVVIAAGGLIFVLPLYWTVIWSTWDVSGIFSFPPKLLPGSFLLDNLSQLDQAAGIARVTANSLFVAVVSTAGALFFCSLAGFAFAKYRFRGRTPLFYLLLATMAIPGQITVVPLFVIMLRLNWINTYQALIVPGLIPAFGIFLMRQSIEEAIPDELLDAARMDGARELRLFLQVVFPIILPNAAALSILLFAANWGNLFWPLVAMRTPEMFTLPLALASLIGTYSRPYGAVMIGSLISILPPLILFIALQRYFIKGLVAGTFR